MIIIASEPSISFLKGGWSPNPHHPARDVTTLGQTAALA
jgi:hypothetical protein